MTVTRWRCTECGAGQDKIELDDDPAGHYTRIDPRYDQGTCTCREGKVYLELVATVVRPLSGGTTADTIRA